MASDRRFAWPLERAPMLLETSLPGRLRGRRRPTRLGQTGRLRRRRGQHRRPTRAPPNGRAQPTSKTSTGSALTRNPRRAALHRPRCMRERRGGRWDAGVRARRSARRSGPEGPTRPHRRDCREGGGVPSAVDPSLPWPSSTGGGRAPGDAGAPARSRRRARNTRSPLLRIRRMLGFMPGNGTADSFAVSMQREGVDDRPVGD